MTLRASNIALGCAYVASALAMSIGTLGFLNPIALTRQFGVPLPDTAPIESTTYVRVYGSRNFALGAGMFCLAWNGERRAAGMLSLCGIVNVLADGYLTQQYRQQGWLDGNVLAHIVFVPMGLVVGLVLVRGR